jgi:hypothetical protein
MSKTPEQHQDAFCRKGVTPEGHQEAAGQDRWKSERLPARLPGAGNASRCHPALAGMARSCPNPGHDLHPTSTGLIAPADSRSMSAARGSHTTEAAYERLEGSREHEQDLLQPSNPGWLSAPRRGAHEGCKRGCARTSGACVCRRRWPAWLPFHFVCCAAHLRSCSAL